MSKILIVAEKVNDELLFLKKIREITHESIVTIKSNLAEKKPFYQGFLYGNEHENTERLVFQIIDFTKKNNDIIKLYEIGDDDIFENLMHKKKYEISETTFKNLMGSASETLQVFEDEDDNESSL